MAATTKNLIVQAERAAKAITSNPKAKALHQPAKNELLNLKAAPTWERAGQTVKRLNQLKAIAKIGGKQ